MTRYLLLTVFLSQILYATAPPAMAATDTAFTLGRQQFDHGRFEEAYREFSTAFGEDPANPEVNFYLGRAAFESGRYEEAVMAFDRILIATPDNPRVKLELARAYMRLGSLELAKQYFSEVQATNPPPQVWRNIQAFLDAIAISERHHFLNGIFTFGAGYDDNVNVAPTDQSLDINLGGIILPITIDQQAVGDEIFNTTLVVNHIYKPENPAYTWKTTVVNYNAFYESESSHDINYLSLATGPVRQGPDYLWQIQALVNTVDLAHDRYQSAWGLNTSLTWLVDTNTAFNLGFTAQEKNNHQDDDKDAENYLMTAGDVFTFGPNRLSTSFGWELENAVRDYNSYKRLLGLCRYDRQLPHDLGLFASYRFQHTKYREPRPLDTLITQSDRTDMVSDLACGLTLRLWQSPEKNRTLSGQISYTHTKAESNIALYEYKKNVTAAALSLNF